MTCIEADKLLKLCSPHPSQLRFTDTAVARAKDEEQQLSRATPVGGGFPLGALLQPPDSGYQVRL